MPLQGPAAPPPVRPNNAASNKEPAVTHRAEPPQPPPAPSPLGNAEKLCPCSQKESPAPTRVPRLRAVVESQAFRNILVDEMDMMMSRAATLIQANWRRHQLRQKLVSQVTAARAIQEAWRRFSTRRLRHLSHAPLKKAKAEDENIPYHPPAQVRFQQVEDAEPLGLPAKASKQTQFPSADVLPPPHPSQGAAPPGDPSVTFLPHQTVTIKLVGPGAPEASFHPCLLTRTVHSSGVGSQAVKMDEASIKASKAGAPGPTVVSQRAAIKTQVHSGEGPQKVPPQTPEVAKTAPGMTATKIPPQLYPPTYPPPAGRMLGQPRVVATVPRPAPQTYPPATVTVTSTPSQMFPPPPSSCASVKSPPLPSGLASLLGRLPMPTCPPPPARTPLQSCLAVLMNRSPAPTGPPEPAAQMTKPSVQMRPTAPVTNAPTQSRAVTTKGSPTLLTSSLRPPQGPSPAPAKTPPPKCPTPGMGRARSLLQPPSTVTKASLHTCRTVTISRTPTHAQQAQPLPKTAPQTRLAAMITKTPAHLRSVAAVLRTLCTPPTPPVPAGHAKAAPPPPPGVPATASSQHLSLTITRMKTTAVNTRHVTRLLKVPSQPTLPDGPVRFAPPQPASGKAKPASPSGGPVEMDKNRALPSKQGKAERTTGPMAQGMPWGARAHPGPGKLQSQVVLQPTPVTPFLQPRAGAHPLTQLNKVLSQRPDSQTLAHSPPSTNLSQAKTPPQGRPPAATTKAPPQNQLPLGSSRVPFMPPQATSKLNSKPQSPPLLTSFKTSPLRPAGHPASSVDSGDSQVARGSPTPATQSQEELAASQVAALCSELASMLSSQEDLRVLLAKGLPQGDTRTALGQALSKEVLATSVGRALPQGMVGLALLRALSWTELGTALSRALSRGELRTELTKTMQGQLADVLSKALTEEERAALGQALCQGELGAVLSQALLRTGLVLPKASLKPASRGMAPRAPVEMDFRGPPGSWGPTLGPGRPQQSKVRGPWPEAWGGCVPAWPVGFLAEMGDGLLMVGSSCSLVVSGVPPFLGRVLLTLEPYFNSPRSLRGPQETVCPLLGATELLFHLTSWAEGLGPEQPAGSPFPLPANLWQPLHANGVGPSTGQPSLPRAPSQASHRTPTMGRGAPQAWETSGVGRGAVDKASRTARGCGRDMRPKTVTFRGHVCECQLSGVRQTDPGACRCFVSKQHPAKGVSGTVQRPRATSAKPGRQGCREVSGVTPSARQATKYSRVPLSPARPKTGDRCLSLMPSPLTPCHRRVLGSRVEPRPLQVAPPIALPPPPVVAPPPVLAPPTCPIPCALEPLGGPQLGLAAQGSPECQAKHLPSNLASASSSAEGLLTRTLFLGSSQSLQPNASSFSLSATSLDNLLVASEAQEGSLNKAEKEAGGPGESPTFCNVSELIPALARTPASSRVTFKLHWRPHNRRSLGEASDPNFLGWDQLSLKRSRSLGSVHMPPVAPQLGPGVGKSCFRDLGALKGCGLFDRPQSPVATPILLEPITCTNVAQDGGGNFPKIQISQAPKAGSPGRQRCPLSNTAGVAPGPECPPLTCQVLPSPGHLTDEGAPRQSCPPWAQEVTPDQSQTSATGEVAPISAQLLESITAAPNFAETPKSPAPAQVPAPPALAASGQDDPCSQPQDTPEARACRPFVVQITYSHPYPRCTRSRARGLSSPAAACRNLGPHQSPRSDHFSRPRDPRGNSKTASPPCAPSASVGWEGTRQGAGAGGSPRLCFCGSGVVSDTQGLVAADLFPSVVQRPMSPKGSRSRSPRAPCCALPPRTCVSQAAKEKPPSRSQPSFTWGLLSHRLTISPNTYPPAHPAPCFPPLSPESLHQTPPPALHPSGHSPPSSLESGPGGLLLGSLIRSIGQKTPLSRIPCPPCEPQACPEEPGGGWTPGSKAPSLPQSLIIGLSPRPFQGRTGRMGAAVPSQAPSAPGLLPVLATSVLQGAEQLIPGAEGTLETQGSQVLSSSLGSSQPAVCEATPWVHPNPLVGDTRYSTGSLAEDPSPLQGQMPGLQEVDSRQAQLKGTGPAHLPPRSPHVSKRPIQTGSTTPPPQQRPATTWGASASRSGLRESIKGTGASMAPPSPEAQQMTHTAPMAPQSPSAYRQFPIVPVAPQSPSFHQHEPMAPVVPWSPSFPQQVSMASMEPQGSSFPQQVSVAPVEPQGTAFPQQVSMDPMAHWSPSFHQQVSVAPMEPQGSSFPQQVSVAPMEPQGPSFPQQVSMDPMAPWSPSFHQQVSIAPEAPQSHEQMSEAPVASLSTPLHQQVSMAPQTPTAHQMTHTAPVVPWSPSAYRQQASVCPVTPRVHRALQQAPVAPVGPKAPPALRQAFVAPMTSKTHSALQQAPVSPGTPPTPQQVPVALVAPKVHPVLQQTPVAPVASKAPSALQQVPVAPVAPKVHPVLQQTPVAPMTSKVHQALKQTPAAPVAPEPPSVLQQVPVAPVAPKVHPVLQQTPVAPMTPKVHPALQQTPVAPMAPRVPSERQQVPVTPMTPKVHPTLQQTPVAPVAPEAPSALQKTPVAPKVPSAFQQVPVATMTSKAHRAFQQTPVLLVAPEASSVLQQTPMAPVAPKVPSALQQVPMAAMTPKVHRALQQTPVVPVAPKAPSALQQVPVVPVAPKVHFQQVCVAPVIPKVHSVLQQVPMSPGAPQAHSSLQHAPVAQVEPYNRSRGVVDSSGVLASQGLTHGSSVAPNLPLGSGAGMATPSVSWGSGAIPRTPRVPPCRSEATVTVAGKCLSSCLKKSCRFSHQEAVAPTVPLVTARSVPSLAARRVHQGFVSSPLGLGCACGPTGTAGKYLTPPVLQGAEDPSVAGGSAWNSAGTSRVAVPPRGAWEQGQGVGPWAVGSAAAANPRSSRELASMQVMEKLVIQAVITLQAGVRGYLVRKTIKVWHQWAAVIQAAWRGYCVRRDLARLTRAAVVIQAAWRGFSCRQRRIPYALSPAPWPEATSMSPRMSEHRCFQSCQPNICHLCQSLTSGLGNAPSVVMLVGSSPRTCHMCGQAAPTRVVHGLGQRGRDYSPKKPLSREAAATRIQAAWKGFHVRRQLMQQRTAAQRLQATWRGHSTRMALSSNNLLGLNTWKGPPHTQWPGY